MRKKFEEIVLEKANQIAFCSLKNLHCTPFVKPDGRVAFRVRGDVTGALAELASNPSIPLLDFLNSLDTVKSVIFSLKKNPISQTNSGSAA